MVRFKQTVIPGCLISLCGRFTIKPAAMVTGDELDAGWFLRDGETGQRMWGSTIESLKRLASDAKKGTRVV